MNTSTARLIQNTQDEIKNIDKPLSAYQYYTKHFLEQWHNISEDDKDAYYIKAKLDKERYEKEKNDIMEKEAVEIRKLNIFLSRSHGKVPCIGLDNGFTSYEVIGPITKVELFSEAELAEMIKKNIINKDKMPKYKTITIDKSTWKFNKRAAKKWNVTVYGGNTNNSETWWGIRENYTGKTGNYTNYHNYKGETWTENY